MVEPDEAPLLFWAEGPGVALPEPGPEAQGSSGWSLAPWGGSAAAREAEEDQIVAVFVVTFDPRSGERLPGAGVGGARG